MNRYFHPGRCPDCGTPLTGADRCVACGLLQTGQVAEDLLFALQHADRVLDVLRRISVPAAPLAGPGEAPPAPAGAPATTQPGVASTRRLGLPSVSVPVVLLGLGTICVLVAAVVFVAVTWSDLSLGWRTTILLAVTALATSAAVWVVRLGLRGAGEALTLVSSGLLLIDLLAGNDAGLPVLSAVQGRPFDWVVAVTMLTTGLAWVLFGTGSGLRSLLGEQLVAVLAVAAMVWLAILDWDYDLAWLAAIVTVSAAALALLLRRMRILVSSAAVGGLTVLAWTYLTLAGLLRAVLSEGPRELFLRLDGGPLLASAAVAAAVAAAPRLPRPVRVVAAVFAVAGPVVVGLLVSRELPTTATLLVVAVAALALGVAAVPSPAPWRDGLRVVAVLTTLLPGAVLVLAAGLALEGVVDAAYEPWTRTLTDPVRPAPGGVDVAVWSYLPMAGLVAAALLLAVFGRVRRRQLPTWAGVGAGIGALTSLLSASWPLVVVGAVLGAAAVSGVAVLERARTRRMLALTGVPVAVGIVAALPSVAGTALFLSVHGFLLVAVAGLLRGRTRAVLVAIGVATASAALQAVADLTDLSVPVTGLVFLTAAVAVLGAAEVVALRPDGASWRAGLEAVAVPMTTVAVLQAADDDVARTVAFAVTATAAGVVAALVRDRWSLASVSAVFVAATAHQVVHLAGAAAPWSAVAVAAVAGLTAVVAQRVLRDRPTTGQQLATWTRGPRPALEITGVVMGVVAVEEQLPDSAALTAGLTCLGVGAVMVSLLSADRRRAAWLGSALLVLASWVRLSALDVDVVEAYTLPGSAALLVTGLMWLRRHPGASTWRGLATPLTLGVGPSLVVALQEPTSLRALLVGLVGLALVGVGVWLRWGAPLVVGAVTVGLLAVVNIAPYAAAVPRWVLFGTSGVGLLVLGVTWERRRQDLQMMQRYAGRLR